MFHTPKRLTRVLAALGIAVGLGAGAAGIAAATTSSSTPTQVDVPQPAADQGNTDFTPPGEKAEAPDAAGEATTAESEPANDPEPGHQDPNGANVDHTPAGETPEAETAASAQG